MRITGIAAILTAAGLATATVSAGQHSSSAARATLDRALDAVGGRQALAAITGFRANYLLVGFNNGQEEWPGAPTPLAIGNDGIIVLDFEGLRAWRQYHIANATPVFRCAMIPGASGFMQDTAQRGRCGGARGFATLASTEPAWLLRAIARAPEAPTRMLPDRTIGGIKAVGVEVRLVDDTLRVWSDAVKATPLALERVIDDPVRGPTLLLMSLSHWLEAGSVRLPMNVVGTMNGEPAWNNRRSQISADAGGLDTLLAAVKTLPQVNAPSALRVVQLHPGVYRLEGPTHSPLAIQQGDSIVLLEAPSSDAFLREVIDSLRGRFPDTPVKSFIVSHHHADHLSGARAAFALGLPAIASSEIAEFVRRVGVGPSGNPSRARRVRAISDSLVVGTGATRFTLYHVPSSHARGLLAAYFPETKLLWDPDLTVGPPHEIRHLYDFAQARRLEVSQVSPAHGPVVPWERFLQRVPGLQKQ